MKFTNGYALTLIACCMLLLLASCKRNTLFDANIKIDKSLWDYDKPLAFTVDIKDTTQVCNFYINIRNAGMYPFSNIFLFLSTRYPNGQYDRDTLEITLASPKGEWLGDGLGDIWDNKILFRKNVRFPQAGEYHFEMTHAMRMNPLPGIMDAGIAIEKADINK